MSMSMLPCCVCVSCVCVRVCACVIAASAMLCMCVVCLCVCLCLSMSMLPCCVCVSCVCVCVCACVIAAGAMLCMCVVCLCVCLCLCDRRKRGMPGKGVREGRGGACACKHADRSAATVVLPTSVYCVGPRSRPDLACLVAGGVWVCGFGRFGRTRAVAPSSQCQGRAPATSVRAPTLERATRLPRRCPPALTHDDGARATTWRTGDRGRCDIQSGLHHRPTCTTHGRQGSV